MLPPATGTRCQTFPGAPAAAGPMTDGVHGVARGVAGQRMGNADSDKVLLANDLSTRRVNLASPQADRVWVALRRTGRPGPKTVHLDRTCSRLRPAKRWVMSIDPTDLGSGDQPCYVCGKGVPRPRDTRRRVGPQRRTGPGEEAGAAKIEEGVGGEGGVHEAG